MTAPTALLAGPPTTYPGTPAYEGANIRTWVGFKHFMYLVEAAVLEHFRRRGVGARELYHSYGLGLEIVDNSVQLPAVLEVDDRVSVTVTPAPKQKPGHGAAFTATIAVARDGGEVTVLKGKLRVALIAEKDAPATSPAPADLAPYVLPEVGALADATTEPLPVPAGRSVEDVLTPAGSGSFLWSWRIPYFYCHYSDRLQHSGYVRALEEVVDRFLHARGLGIGDLLRERGWIPVVSRTRIRLLADAHMEETLHTVFTVQDILKDISYTARMDCYVRRGDLLVPTATATIMHGYAVSRGPGAGSVAVLDADTKARLLGDRS